MRPRKYRLEVTKRCVQYHVTLDFVITALYFINNRHIYLARDDVIDGSAQDCITGVYTILHETMEMSVYHGFKIESKIFPSNGFIKKSILSL